MLNVAHLHRYHRPGSQQIVCDNNDLPKSVWRGCKKKERDASLSHPQGQIQACFIALYRHTQRKFLTRLSLVLLPTFFFECWVEFFWFNCMLCFAYAAHILAKLFQGRADLKRKLLSQQSRVRVVVVINNKRQSSSLISRSGCSLYKLFCSTTTAFLLFLIHRFSDLTQPQEMVGGGQTNIVLQIALQHIRLLSPLSRILAPKIQT